jgi:hypothetical protein
VHGVWIERTDDGGAVLEQEWKALAARPPVLDRLIKPRRSIVSFGCLKDF